MYMYVCMYIYIYIYESRSPSLTRADRDRIRSESLRSALAISEIRRFASTPGFHINIFFFELAPPNFLF